MEAKLIEYKNGTKKFFIKRGDKFVLNGLNVLRKLFESGKLKEVSRYRRLGNIYIIYKGG